MKKRIQGKCLLLTVLALGLVLVAGCVTKPGAGNTATGPIKAVECVKAPEPIVATPVSSATEQPKEAAASQSTEEMAASNLSSEREQEAEVNTAMVTDDREAKFRSARDEFEKEMVHFDYDKSLIRSVDIPILDHQVAFMKDHPDVVVTILGHCDERGTAEYNLALGQRRADAIRDYMLKKGIPANRLEAVSMGAEAPIATGHDEKAWAQNRRGEFIVK